MFIPFWDFFLIILYIKTVASNIWTSIDEIILTVYKDLQFIFSTGEFIDFFVKVNSHNFVYDLQIVTNFSWMSTSLYQLQWANQQVFDLSFATLILNDLFL